MNPAPAPRPSTATRPFLVPHHPAAPPRTSPLALWHLLSLDAPTVAATWTAFIAWTAGLPFSPSDTAAIFVAVWMLYAADRLLDARPLFTVPFAPELQARHRFHHRHRVRFLRAIALASLPLLFLLHRSQPAVLHLYILLGTLLVVWLLLIHARPSPSATAHRLPKELAVGLFFPAAIFVPTLARAPSLHLALVPGAFLFANLCTLNCLFLYAWEHSRSPGHAHASTRWAIRHLPALAISCVLLGVAATLAITLTPSAALPHPAAAFLASSAGAALLLGLHALRHRTPTLTLRALADLVLLTPIPIVILSSLHRAH